jgi:membrane associated rhomboid family serine protease
MIGDRAYMRETSGRMPLSATVKLMIVLVAVFVLQSIDDVYGKTGWQENLALSADCFGKGHLWQLVTFQFLHGGIWHLAGNLLGLWFFGRFVENVLGVSRYLTAYFGGGVVGGILQGILQLAFTQHFGFYTVGASAGVLTIFAIFARLESGGEVRMYGILPIKAGVLLWIFLAISLFFTLVPSPRGGWAAHAAHLGGLLSGILWVRAGWHRDFMVLPWEGWIASVRSWLFSSKRTSRKTTTPRLTATKAAPQPPVHEKATDFMAQEIDPILDKISAHGIHSLTDRERKILDAARSRMAKR